MWRYQILGADPNDSFPTIKKKYRKLILKYHPDKAVINNLDPDYAKENFVRIDEAFRSLENEFRNTVPEPTPTVFYFNVDQLFQDLLHTYPDLNKTEPNIYQETDFTSFMEFMEDTIVDPEQEKQEREINQGIDDLMNDINKMQETVVRGTNTIDTKFLLQNQYSKSIEIILYAPKTDIDNKKTKVVSFKRTRRCRTCSQNICKVCEGFGIMNCKKCMQHGFFIKKNCKICQGKGYISEKKKLKVTLNHPDSPSFYIYPEESDELKGYDLPGDVYVKVVGDY